MEVVNYQRLNGLAVVIVAVLLVGYVAKDRFAFYPTTKKVYPDSVVLYPGGSETLYAPVAMGDVALPEEAELVCYSNVNLYKSVNPKVRVNGVEMISYLYPGGPFQWGERDGRYYMTLAYPDDWYCCGNVPIVVENIGSTPVDLYGCYLYWVESDYTRQPAGLCGNNPNHPICPSGGVTTTTTTTLIPTTTTTTIGCVSDCAWVGCSGDYRCEEVQPGCRKRRFDESCQSQTTTTIHTTTTTTLPSTTTTTSIPCSLSPRTMVCPGQGGLCPTDVDASGCPRWRCDLCEEPLLEKYSLPIILLLLLVSGALITRKLG